MVLQYSQITCIICKASRGFISNILKFTLMLFQIHDLPPFHNLNKMLNWYFQLLMDSMVKQIFLMYFCVFWMKITWTLLEVLRFASASDLPFLQQQTWGTGGNSEFWVGEKKTWFLQVKNLITPIIMYNPVTTYKILSPFTIYRLSHNYIHTVSHHHI